MKQQQETRKETRKRQQNRGQQGKRERRGQGQKQQQGERRETWQWQQRQRLRGKGGVVGGDLAGGAEEGEGSGPRVVPVTGICENVGVAEVSPDPEAEEEGPRGDLPPGPEPGGAAKKMGAGAGREVAGPSSTPMLAAPGVFPNTTGTSPREDSKTRN
jgi:hypothetical protein